jgi:crotonobetainyl-CoA:carnitine CoA-transferase CaiB-like acyl-CoA transferase
MSDANMAEGALAGLRVVDLTDDSGRFATKILNELGADVVRVTRAGSRGNMMVDPVAAARGGVLDWWYDGGKRRCTTDLNTEAGRDMYRQLSASAELIIETEPPGRLASYGIDHGDLLALQPRLVQVSLTPFGRTGPKSGWVTSDLVSAAHGGFMAVTGLPDRPLNVWGRQAYNHAGFTAVIAGLSGVRAARLDGHGRHFDVSIHESVTGSIENIFMQYFFDDLLPTMPKIAQRQGALHWLRAYDLAECKTGYAMITPTPTPELFVNWMVEAGHEPATEFTGMDLAEMLERIDELMSCIHDFVLKYDAMELWWDAQARHCALGGVHDVPAVAKIPQYEHRQLFQNAELDGTVVRGPARMVVMSETPASPLKPPAGDDTALDELLAEWGASTAAAPSPAAALSDRLARPLNGLRVADFTWVLAGPFCTRMLGDLGADVIRLQNEERSTLVNRPDYPYYFVWNRSKRSATIDMKHPQALAAVRRLIENCDVLIENYSAGVLEAWGLDYETVHEWNPRLVYVTMSGCGHDGPWKHVISYAPTVHALCGITHLTNFADRGDVGAGFSLNDHLAGYSAAVTTLAALEARDRTGRGQKIDMAQLEIGTYCIGPALIDHFANGRAAQPAGNTDGLHDHVPNEVYATSDGFVAVSVTCDEQWPPLAAVIGIEFGDPALADEETRRQRRSEIDSVLTTWASTRTADDVMLTLQAAGVPAGSVQHAGELFATDPQHRARGFWQEGNHAVFGPRHVDTFPALIDSHRIAVDHLSPAYLGEHNFDVWAEVAGYEFEEVATGMAEGLFS